MLNNPYLNPSQLLANPFALPIQNRSSLNLNQVEGFTPVDRFTDETNTEWSLAKASTDSTVDIPDPKTLQIVDYWNHEFPKELPKKLYIYVVEGIRKPRVETEQPTRVLYQWFSPTCIMDFRPEMITEREWLKANVYSAPVVNARVSKLNALCQVPSGTHNSNESTEDKLLVVEGITNDNSRGNTSSNGQGKPNA